MKHTFVRAILLPACGALLGTVNVAAVEVAPTVIERGPHHRVWTGELSTYTELETGMNYFDPRENEWKPSSIEIAIGAEGASATRGFHKAHFSGNLSEPSSVVWVTPEGKQIKTRLLGLSYYCRATHRSVWIAELKPEVSGVLHPPNRVVYADAFDSGVAGEVHYVYTKSRFSATVVLLGQLPSPSDWGLNPDTTSLEVVTELFELPMLEKFAREVPVNRDGQAPMPDEQLKLGTAEIGEGRAFRWDAENPIPVAKTLTRIDGRDLLFESLDYISAKAEIDALPAVAGMMKPSTVVKNGRTVPGPRQARAAKAGTATNIQLAASPFRPRGFWVDWEGTLSSGTNDYVFAPNHTTYISGQVNLSNTNYLMGGTVIKFAPTNSAGLTILGQLICQTGPYEMAVLTARDDHSVGSPVGTNALSGHYAEVAVQIPGYPSSELSYVRIAHAKQAIHYTYSMYGTTHNVNHSQFVNCGVGFYPLNVTVLMRNCLMSRVRTNFFGSQYYPSSARCEQLSLSESTRLNDNSYLTLYLTNALLANVTNNGAGYSASSAGVRTDSGSSVFSVVGAGSHYLPAASSHRGAGTTNINPLLAAALSNLTVDAPLVITNSYTTNVTFAPQAQRGKAPGQSGYTVGYWYPPIDYCFGAAVLANATAVLTNGVVVGGFGEVGLRVENNAVLVSEGTPVKRNHIVRYSTVQEQSMNWGGGSVVTNRLIEGYHNSGSGPTGRFRFTDFETLAGSGYLLYSAASGAVFGTLSLRDCELNSGTARIAGTEGGRVSLTNNLFVGVESAFRDQPAINAYNNLFHRGLADVAKVNSTNAWTFKDNVFDRVSVVQTTALTHDYNGYITNAVGQSLTNSGSNDVFTNKFVYHAGALGQFYQPSTSIFINEGSTTAHGLYHYTVLTNSVKETNSTVDLGYHWVAVNAQGQPLDSDGDGIADYLEDTDGDGFTDAGENSFANPVLSVANSVNYVRGGPAKRLDTNAIAYDIDTPNFAGGQLSVWVVAYGTENDRLGIHNEGTDASLISVTNNTVYYGGLNIGTFSGGSGDAPLVISLNGNVSNPVVQALVRNITFHNISDTEAFSSRILQYTLSDGTGGTGAAFQNVNLNCAQRIDAMLLVDVSQSIEIDGFFEAVKTAATNFVSLLDSSDRVGLISFAGDAYLNSPLTNNGAAVRSMIMGLTTNGGTLFSPPLDLARAQLTNTSANVMPLIVLLSDGLVQGSGQVKESNRVAGLVAAARVRGDGIRIISFAYGTNSGVNNGTNMMRAFATSEDDYFHAPDAAQIDIRYNEIEAGLCRGLTPPQIAITSPANPTELTGPATFRVETSTSDSDGFVKKVQFFKGSTSLGVVTNQPFQFIWNNAPTGTNILTAVATDDDNLTNTSSPVVIIITNCPTRTMWALTLSNYNLFGGLSTTGHVTITGPAPRGGQTVLLSCTNPYVSIPPSVTITQGGTNVSFHIDTRGVPIDQSALISAALNGSTRGTNLNLYATNAYGAGVFRGQCGPMDVAFLVSYGDNNVQTGAVHIRHALMNAAHAIDLLSGGDYQLALVGITNSIHVMEPFATNNKDSFLTNVALIESVGNDSSTQPSDEALNMVINNLTTNGRPRQYGNFTNGFRAHARKVVVLIVDQPPAGFSGGYDPGLDNVNAHLRAVEAYLKDIQICAVLVGAHQPDGEPAAIPIMQDYAVTTGAPYLLAAGRATNLFLTLPQALSGCGAQNGEVVFVRDDQRQLAYSAFTLNDATKEVAAKEAAGFDLTGIDGAVTGARARRSGQLLQKYGSYTDVQIGVRSAENTNFVSYGALLADAHTNGVAVYYDNRDWDLPFSFYPDVEQHLGQKYLVELLDRVNGACGNNFEVIDTPAADYPSYRNALTFKVLRPLQIPQGRCRDFILSGANLPVSDTWTISLWGQTIASASLAKGWSVEPDYTAYGGFNICVPTNALVSTEYEVRYKDGSIGGSAYFEVVPGDTQRSAPVLKPLELSSSRVATNSGSTVTLRLDAPAPPGGAVVSLASTLTNGLPPFITIPAGQTQSSFIMNVTQPVTSNTTNLIAVSYNGERRAAFTIVHQTTNAPPIPDNVQTVAGVRRVTITWDPVPSALYYRLHCGGPNGGCPPAAALVDRLTDTFYVHDQLEAGLQYCYAVSAVNSFGSNTSGCHLENCVEPLGDELGRPIIDPPGGKFFDSVSVTMTNFAGIGQIYYSTNGFWPTNETFSGITNNVALYTPGTVLKFTTDTVLKAKTYYDGEWSLEASRDFVIIQARPLSCGSSNVLTLSDTNWPSPVRGPNYNCERFTFVGKPGKNVTIKVRTTEFAPYISLIDPNGQVVAQTTKYHPTVTEVVHTCTTNGNYIIEVSPLVGWMNAHQEFSISLECVDMAKLRVLADGAPVPSGSTIEMGVASINANLTKAITITNWGATTLTLTNFSVGPNPRFTVSPTNVTSIATQSFVNLTVTFNSSGTGLFTGTLYFVHNDPEEESPAYAISLVAHANPTGTFPTNNIVSPTNGQVFTFPNNVPITANAGATGTNMARVDFYVIGPAGKTFLGSAIGTNNPYQRTWTNQTPGTYTVRAVPIDAANRVGWPSNVTISFNNPPRPVRDYLLVGYGSSSNDLPVLDNDRDFDGDTLKVASATTNTSKGKTAVTLAGKLFYDPNPGQTGRDNFTYTVSDGRGGTATANVSVMIMPQGGFPDVPSVAHISFPTNNTEITAPIDVVGTVDSQFMRSYRLEYRRATFPWPPWIPFVEGDVSVTNAVLGVFDPTGLPNGQYHIHAIVEDWDRMTWESQAIVVQVGEGFKVGHFTVAFNDLSIPVSGLPITLTRTYDSRVAGRDGAPPASDFGTGWTLDVASARLEKSGVLGTGWDKQLFVFGALTCVVPTEPKVITITFPNDERFQFEAVLDINGLGSHCANTAGLNQSKALMLFDPLPGTTGTLEPLHEPVTLDINTTSGFGVTLHEERGDTLNTYGMGPIYNPTEFLFTTLDKRQFYFNAAGKVSRMVDRNGNTLTFGDDGIIHSSGKSVLFVRDNVGRITEIYDPNGLDANGQKAGHPAITYTYEGDNLTHVSRLVDRAEPTYVTTQFVYTNATYPHFLSAIIDPRGITGIRNEFDEDGRLKSHTDADGKTITYLHDIHGKKETIVDRLGNTNVFHYDTRGNVTTSVNALNETTLFTYDGNGNKLSETNPKGETIAYTYDASNLLQSISNAVSTVSFDYNQFGQPTTSIDPLQRITKSQYDAFGNLTNVLDTMQNSTRFVYDTNGNPVSQIDPANNVVTNRYDEFGRLTNTVELSISQTNSYAYDANGNRTNQITTRNLLGGGIEHATNTFTYDGQDRLVHATEADGKTSSVVYNEIGKQKESIDKLGHKTQFEYDRHGRLQHTKYADSSGETSGYDPEGRRTFSTNRLGYVTQYIYDSVGRLTQTIFPDNAINTTVYDSAGRVSHTVDTRGTTNAFGYDNAGRRTSVTNAWGIAGLQQVMTYAYDAAGNLTNMVDAAGRPIDYEYDDLNRLVKTIFPATTNGGARAYTLTGYDSLGRRVAETNEASIVTRFGFDGAGRLRAVTNAWGSADATWATYAYDEYGNQTNQTDALNRRTSYFYDSFGRRVKRKLPGAQEESFAYDVAGNLRAHTNFNGLVVTNQYDSMNRLVKKFAGTNELETYTYDALGRLTNRTDASGTWRFTYDERDRLKTNAGPVGSLFYKYDAAGNLTSTESSTANGTKVDYQYDRLNRLTNVVDHRLTGTNNTAYQYDAVGNLATLKYPNTVTNLYQYDARNRLTSLLWKAGSTTLGSFSYTLNVIGQRTELIDSVNSVNRTFSWTYDSLSRLRDETITGGTPTGGLNYKFDQVSNRTNLTSTISLIPSQINTFNTNDWLNSDGYDNNGNTTSSSGATYAYDYANRLTSFVFGTTNVSFTYNAEGHRIRKTVGSTTTLYLVDVQNLTGYSQILEELIVSGGTNNLVRQYTYGTDLISQRQVSPVLVTFYGYDGLGSVRFLTRTNAAITNTYVFDAYGTLLNSTGSVTNSYLFAGEYFDAHLGLYHHRARDRHPGTGRFLTMDVFEGIGEEPLSLHKYLYVHANPINGLDPSGNFMILDLVISFAPRVAMYERRFKYVRMGYQAYTRVSDALDIAQAVHWVGALTAAIYFDSAAHAGTLENEGDEFGFDASDAIREEEFEGRSSAGPAEASLGATALWLLFERAATHAHHIATDKHSVWTPRFDRIFKTAGLTLQDGANLVDVKGHAGPHPEEYHREVFRRLTASVRGLKPGSPEMRRAIVYELRRMAKECITPGTMLNRLVLKKALRK